MDEAVESTAKHKSPAALADSAWRILAVVLTIAVVGLHIYATSSLGSFWRDEVITLNLATLPIGEVVDLHRYDGYPPLYAFLLRAWTLFGLLTSPAWLRCFGLVVGLATIASLWRVARWTGKGLPVIGLIIVCANPAIIRFGDMLRPAGLGVTFTILVFGAFWRLVRDGTRRDMARAALFAVLLVNTVYQSALVVLALAVAGVVVSAYRRRRRTAMMVVGAAATAALSLIPWIPYIRAQSILLSTGTDDAPLAVILRAALSAFAPLWLLSPVLIALAVLWRRKYRSGTEPDGTMALETYAALSAALTTVVLGAFLLNLEYFPSIWYVFPIVTLGACALDCVLQPAVYVGVRWVVVAASLFWLPGLPGWTDFPRAISNVREIAAIIEEVGTERDFVVVAPPSAGLTFNYYYHGRAPWSTAPPIDEMRVYRLDLVRAAADIDPLTPEVRARARRTLETGGALWWVGFSRIPLETILPDPPPACGLEIEPTRTPVDALERLFLRSWSVGNCERTTGGSD